MTLARVTLLVLALVTGSAFALASAPDVDPAPEAPAGSPFVRAALAPDPSAAPAPQPIAGWVWAGTCTGTAWTTVNLAPKSSGQLPGCQSAAAFPAVEARTTRGLRVRNDRPTGDDFGGVVADLRAGESVTVRQAVRLSGPDPQPVWVYITTP